MPLTKPFAQILCITALLACPSAAFSYYSPAIQQEAAEPLIEKARQDMERKEWWRAKRRLKLALQLNPDITEAYYLLALAQREEGEMYEAISNVQEAIKRQEYYPEARYLLARLFFETGSMKFARQALDAAMAQSQPSFDLYKLKGDIEFSTNRELARESYEEALRLAAPDDEDTPKIRERMERLRQLLELGKQYLALRGDQDDWQYTRPMLLNAPRPNYSEEAREKKISGVVEMAVLIDENGNVGKVFLLSRLGYGLDEEAVRAVQELKFSPAIKDGKPAPFWQCISIEYNLK